MNAHSSLARLSLREILEAAREDHRKLPKSPCYEQTREEIENYYRHEPVGARAAVRHTQYGILCYDIVEIERRNSPKRQHTRSRCLHHEKRHLLPSPHG
jgi:hypothetical protein